MQNHLRDIVQAYRRYNLLLDKQNSPPLDERNLVGAYDLSYSRNHTHILEAGDGMYPRKPYRTGLFEPITQLRLAQNKLRFLSLFPIFSYLLSIASSVPDYCNNALLLYLIDRDLVTKIQATTPYLQDSATAPS